MNTIDISFNIYPLAFILSLVFQTLKLHKAAGGAMACSDNKIAAAICQQRSTICCRAAG